MDKETNFFDLCVATGRAIGRACAWGWSVLQGMIRLTWRYWWIVVPVVVLSIAAAIYHTRPDNIHYRVNAVALINGASRQQFEDAFAPLRTGRLLPADSPMLSYMSDKRVQRVDLFRVIDALHDEEPDYVDFKRKTRPTDTVNVQMQDRVCIQFVTPAYAIPQIPEIEKAMLDVLNSNEALQQAYVPYLDNLREEVAFNHRQALKLDSLTSCYYYNIGRGGLEHWNNSINFNADRKVRIFLDEIYKQQRHMQITDHRLQLATAPVVLENHFTVDSKPVMTRTKCTVLFLILGWALGCLIAVVIDKRKAIYAWLKQ